MTVADSNNDSYVWYEKFEGVLKNDVAGNIRMLEVVCKAMDGNGDGKSQRSRLYDQSQRMTNSGSSPSKGKEPAHQPVQCLMLSSSNYNVWLLRMKAIMKVYKVWEAIEPGSSDEEKNNMAVVLIFQSIPESMIMQIGDLDSPKAIWDAIKSSNIGADRVKEARLQTLATEFDNLRMKETEAIDDFAGKLSCIASKSASLGETMDETKLVKKILKSLPLGKYIHIVATLEQTLDLKTIKFEDIVGRLKAYEERLKEEDVVEPQSKLLFNKTETSSSSTNNRGRGQGTRGRGGNRGRGNRGGNNSSRSNREEGSSNKNKNRSKEKKPRYVQNPMLPM
ncbi:uncharacterized protein LOC110907735 [Helianthus annuus]|uniref:uncharacterized protein LOC110907735 n=1 Tax=Helianthus annuus TaxID=4232 RepID=UPI001652FEB7|nr:uncharacterized protein LOC110907735 [Helianthus annuus]